MRLSSLEAIPVRLGFRGTFATSRGTIGQTSEGADHVVVKAVADDGTIGWGECRPSRHWSYETLESAVSSINRYFAPALLGHDPSDFEGLAQILDFEIAPGFTRGQPIAKSGVEIACWDLVGKRQGVPLQQLLGGTRQQAITLSWTVLGKSADEAAASVATGQAAGYHHFNFKVGFGQAIDAAVARTIRELAPEAFLWADANGGCQLDDAVALSRMLAEVGVAILEQPLPVNQYGDWRELRRRSALPIGVDEGIYAPEDLRQLIGLDAIDFFTIKLCRMGGIGAAQEALSLAQSAGLTCYGSGLTESEIVLAAYAHLLSAFGIDTPNALNGRQFLTERLADGLCGEGDRVPVPTGPGLGVTVDEARLAELRIDAFGP